MIRRLISEKKKLSACSNPTHLSSAAWSWQAEERRSLNAPHHFNPLYGPVWEHFGFPVKYNDEGKRLVDKTVTVCRHCGTRKPYDSGNTSSMAMHLKRHHPGVSLTGVKTNAAQQLLITVAFTKICLFVLSFFFFLLIRETIQTLSFLMCCTPSRDQRKRVFHVMRPLK